MTIFDDRPDLTWIRSGGREGTAPGCGGTCPMCRPMAAEKARRRPPAWVTKLDNEEAERPPRNPRYAWLPP